MLETNNSPNGSKYDWIAPQAPRALPSNATAYNPNHFGVKGLGLELQVGKLFGGKAQSIKYTSPNSSNERAQ